MEVVETEMNEEHKVAKEWKSLYQSPTILPSHHRQYVPLPWSIFFT